MRWTSGSQRASTTQDTTRCDVLRRVESQRRAEGEKKKVPARVSPPSIASSSSACGVCVSPPSQGASLHCLQLSPLSSPVVARLSAAQSVSQPASQSAGSDSQPWSLRSPVLCRHNRCRPVTVASSSSGCCACAFPLSSCRVALALHWRKEGQGHDWDGSHRHIEQQRRHRHNKDSSSSSSNHPHLSLFSHSQRRQSRRHQVPCCFVRRQCSRRRRRSRIH
jgi:hypothetical protein